MSAYDNLMIARAKGRPTSKDFISGIFSGFIELSGDRLYGDDGAVTAGIAWLLDMPVTVIALEKGKDTEEKIHHNFGSARPEGYRKALRLMKQAQKFSRPVVCIVDTAGADPTTGAEERGQGEAIARNLMEMMTLRTPIISIIISEGGSGGALALAVADEVWMLKNAIYSVISPEGAASIVWKDTSMTKKAAESLKATAADLYKMDVIERIFDEPSNFDVLYDLLRESLYESLTEKSKLKTDRLLKLRYNRFRKIGEKSF